jgi:hypothetical protein
MRVVFNMQFEFVVARFFYKFHFKSEMFLIAFI